MYVEEIYSHIHMDMYIYIYIQYLCIYEHIYVKEDMFVFGDALRGCYSTTLDGYYFTITISVISSNNLVCRKVLTNRKLRLYLVRHGKTLCQKENPARP